MSDRIVDFYRKLGLIFTAVCMKGQWYDTSRACIHDSNSNLIISLSTIRFMKKIPSLSEPEDNFMSVRIILFLLKSWLFFIAIHMHHDIILIRHALMTPN